MTNKKPTKRLALVVHGLGEQGPGQTLDDLAGGLWGGRDDVRVSSDVQLLQEVDQPDERKLKTFPCHVRRYSNRHSPHDPHTTFAEVYWADLSRADKGPIQIFYGLIKAILGLGHIVRAGAKQQFGDKWPAWVANFIPYLLHGPVAATNAFLAIGALLVLIFRTLFDVSPGSDHAAVLTAGGLSLLPYLIFAPRQETSYYFRVFIGWFALLGWIMAGMAVVEIFWGDPKCSPFETATVLMTPLLNASQYCDGIGWYSAILFVSLEIAWIATLGSLALLALITGWKTLIPKSLNHSSRNSAPPLALIIACAMTWLWFLTISTIWVAANESGQFANIIKPEIFKIALQPLFITNLGIGLTVCMVAITMGQRFLWRRHFKGEIANLNGAFARYPVPRMLLSNALIVGLLLTGAAYVALIVVAILAFLNVDFVVRYTNSSPVSFETTIAFAVIIGSIAFSQRNGIAMALGVGKDLITYFKVEPTQKSESASESELKRMGAFSAPNDYEFDDFRERKRIHGRMQRVFESMCESDEFDEVIIISHSQGTIIATEFARDLHRNENQIINEGACQKLKPLMKTATLVTMGSPFTHVYKEYLPSEFGNPHWITRDKIIKDWINIFRIDDFIGTYIGNSNLKGKWPRNHAVLAGGHTGYWKDAHVLEHLRPLFTQD